MYLWRRVVDSRRALLRQCGAIGMATTEAAAEPDEKQDASLSQLRVGIVSA